MVSALALDVRAGQSNIAQHAVVELLEQVSAPRPFPPTPKSAQKGRQKPTRRGPADIAQLEEAFCIDTISMYHGSKLVV
jgi:hypothetical protein